jgi:diphosphomevalonate decarboxylase
VTLEGLSTNTTMKTGSTDRNRFFLDNVECNDQNVLTFLDDVKKRFPLVGPVDIYSTSNFATAAGLASSSSGFAALTLCINELFELGLDKPGLSELARHGSGSAARSLFGGFTTWRAGARRAEPFLDYDYWPDLRVIVVTVEKGRKKTGSRQAMNNSANTSPFYRSWLSSSQKTFKDALTACRERDMQTLGPLIRHSYLSMFGTMLATTPPILYWQPVSLKLLHLCENLRSSGIPAWETMDAGPQVKIFCEDRYVDQVVNSIQESVPGVETLISRPGPGPRIIPAVDGSA